MTDEARKACIALQEAIREAVKDLSRQDYREVLEDIAGEIEGRLEALTEEELRDKQAEQPDIICRRADHYRGTPTIPELLQTMDATAYDMARRVDAYRDLQALGTNLNRSQRQAFDVIERRLKDELRRSGPIKTRAMTIWLDDNDKVRETLPT